MQDTLNQRSVVFGAAIHLGGETYWRPAADIYRTRTGWLVKYDLAGVKRKDIEVTVKGSKIKVELNGTVILDTDLSKVTEYMANSAHPGKDRTSGEENFGK